jgi:hypothetical protein
MVFVRTSASAAGHRQRSRSARLDTADGRWPWLSQIYRICIASFGPGRGAASSGVGSWTIPWGRAVGLRAAYVTLCGIAQVRVRLSEAQETLLVTLCGRAWDARARQPILGDTMAEAAVEQMDYGFWRAKVNPRRRRSPADRPTLIVAEGLTMYLKPEEGHELMRRLTGHFVHGIIAFDAFNRLTIRVQHLNPAARGCGARMS